MDQNAFQRAERLFHEAMALTPEARASFIEQAADGDVALASRVRRLILRAEAPSTGTLVVDHRGIGDGDGTHAAERLIGTTIGHFHIVELLGEGGFGCVYRAQQQAPIQRSVALKILRGGMDSQQVITRFEAERQALAVMEHPNIARVFDAGRTGQELGARPYFAMELVEGVPVTTYCDEHQLSTEARLELVVTVCHAVQHAHQKGIIHRDLKPSNILVSELDGVATPKVIDFGIAKATMQPIGGRAITEAQQLLGTPQYMSPEQADLDVHSTDTRSDIYSLGVVLYEILTGSTPVDAGALREASYSQLQRLIREQPVERPSTRVSRLGATSQVDPQQPAVNSVALRRRLRGDLDWIVLKALEHDRERRYSSASAFADDIRRHLNHEPVLAGAPGTAYRVRKFVRRHRVGVVAAALVTLAVVGGAVGTTVAMLRARDAADQAIAINQFMSDVLTSATPDRQGADVRLADVLKPASDEASERFARHPEMEAQVRDLLGRVFMNLDMAPQGVTEFKRSADLLESLHGPDDRRSLHAQLLVVQTLLAQERPREAEPILARVISRIERQFGPDDLLMIRAQQLLGGMYVRLGRLDEGDATLRAVHQRAVRRRVDDMQMLQILDGLLLATRGRLQGAGTEQIELVEEIERLAREIVELALRTSPHSMAVFRGQMILAEMMQLRGDSVGAAELSRSLIGSWSERLGLCHVQMGMARSVLADATSDLGQSSEAADLCLQLIACARAKNRLSVDFLIRVNQALPYLERGGRLAEGESAAREFIEVLNAIGGAHGDMLFNADVYIARFVVLQGRLNEAEQLLLGLEARRSEPDDPQSLARLDLTHGELLLKRGEFERSEQHLLQAARTLGDVRIGTTRVNSNDVVEALVALYQAWNKRERAAEYQRMLHEPTATAPASGS